MVSAKLMHEGSGYAVTEATITLDDKPVCDATLTLRVMDFPNTEVAEKMRETAARVGLPSEVAVNG
jgi:3-hydroxyacyl-[acyl-carrier-protein] dehydratase